MALSNAILEKIKKDTENKKKGKQGGTAAVAGAAAAAATTIASEYVAKKNSESSILSPALEQKIAQDIALKKSGMDARVSSPAEDWDSEIGKKGYYNYLTEKEQQEQAKREKEKDEKWWESVFRYMGSSPDSTLPMHQVPVAVDALREDTSWKEPSDEWTSNEKYIFGYLYETDKKAAEEYAASVNNAINKAKKDEERKAAMEKATSSLGHGTVATAGAILNTTFGGADFLMDLAESIARGEITEKDHLSPFEKSQAVTEGISSHLNEKHGTLNEDIPVIGGKGLGDVYGLSTSIAQSSLAAYTGGAPQALIQFFGSAAAAGVDDARARGASDDQAIVSGVINGLAEAIPEAMGIDNLLKIGSSDTLKSLIKNILKQSAAEGMEEGTTSIINNIADNLVMGDLSNFNMMVKDYMSNGMSEEEAKKQAWKDTVEGIVYDSLAGFVSGGIHAGPQTAWQTFSENSNAKNTYGESVNELIEEGLSTPAGTRSHELAAEYRKKLEQGKTLSGAEIRMMVEANEQQFTAEDTAKIQEATENRLRELGESDNVAAIAEILTRQAGGETITKAQQRVLETSKYGQRVGNELNPENIRRGGYSSEWTGNIGTERINADLYNLAQETVGGETAQNVPQEIQENERVKIQPSEINSKPKTEKATQSEYKVSEGGKTISNVTGAEANIAEVTSIKDGKMILKLENGEEVDAENVSFGSQGEALVYEAVANLDNINAPSANILAKNMDLSNVSPEVYAKGIEEAYRFGTYGYPVSEMTREGSFAADLSEQQRMQAYNLGKSNHKAATQAKEEAVRKNRTTQSTMGQVKKADSKKGKVHFEGNRETLNQRQKASIEAIERLSDALGIEFYLFESPVVNGRRQGANGWFDPKDGSIHIDIFAGQNGEATMLFTAAHELTHFIKKWSPEKFDILADFLMEEYGKKGVSVEELVRVQQEKARRNNREISYDVAFEEVVADSMETMLSDGKVMEKLAKLKVQDQTLWEKIKSFIDELVKKIREAYKGLNPNSAEGQYVAEMKDSLERIQQLFTEGIATAAENFHTIGSIDLENFAGAKNTDGEQLFQYRAMEADEDTYVSMLKKWGKFSDAQINNLFTTIDKAMDIIKDNLEALDYAWEADINDRAFSPVKPNSDSLYQVSVDFSTLCRKRLLQQTVQRQLQEALNRPTTREEGIAIRDALMAIQEEGRQIEVACALCYVESARMKSPPQIEKFLDNREAVIKDFFASKSGGNIKGKIQQAEAKAREDLGVGDASLKALPKKVADQIRSAKKEAKASYAPTAEEQRLIDVANRMTVSDFTTPEGLENLAKHYRGLFDAYTSYVRNATKSKGIENDTWWRAGDSASIGDTLIANMNRENGLRSQSWSDFQVIHMMDYIAAVIELSTRNSKMQAYTKVPDYVELMGNTGVMINLSLIPARDYLGSLEYDSTEGIDYKKSLELRDKYHATAGTICIGVDNNQIKQLFEDMTIDYVIPYHKSGMAAHIRKAMHIPTWTEYEQYQSESNLSDTKAKENAEKYGVELLDKADPNYHKHTSFSEWFDLKEAQQIAKMENAHPSDSAKQKKYGIMYGGYMAMQNAANNYLKLCAERGLAPVFSHTKADFTGEDNYWKVLIDRKMVDNITGEVIEQKAIQPIFDEAEVLRILNDELERYPKVKADQEYAIRRVTEKFLSGEIKGGMTSEAVANAMQKPVDNISKTNIVEASKEMEKVKLSDRDSEYLEAVNTGDMKTAQRLVDEAAKEAGYTRTLYHGTASKFNVFGFGRAGIYTTDNLDVAKTYGENIISLYGKQGANVLTVDAKQNHHYAIRVSKDILDFSDYPLMRGKELYSTNDISRIAFREGYDVVVIKNVYDNFSLASDNKQNSLGTDVVYKDSNQVKSSAPVTYDDNGKVIPLSERFKKENEDIRYSDRDGGRDPRKVTEKGVRDLLQKAYNGEFDTASYIPVSIKTPGIIIEHLKKHVQMEDLPIIMNVGKVQQMMEEDDGVYDGGSRLHGLDEDQVISIFKGMFVPEYIVYQKDNGRGVAIVKYEGGREKRALAVIDFGSNGKVGNKKNPMYLNGYQGGFYNILVTAFSPDSLESYLGREENIIVYEKKKGNSQGSSGSLVPSLLNESPFFEKRIPQAGNDVKYSLREPAPTFYSLMGKVVDGIKSEKVGANGVIPYLKGKGVKDEEIKWSGIEAFLEGKKSVTKQELQEFVAGSMLQIGEQRSGVNQEAYDELETLWVQHAGVSLSETFSDDFDLPLTEDNMADVFDNMERDGYDVPSIEDQRHMLELARKAGNEGRWAKYKLGGGRNYREMVFIMPNSSYSNQAMRTHWGEDAEGILAHARIQDFETDDGKMLFIEELQSDWHNAGSKHGYKSAIDVSKKDTEVRFEGGFYELYYKGEDTHTGFSESYIRTQGIAKDQIHDELIKDYKHSLEMFSDMRGKHLADDAPFSKTYHEYVLKRLIREAAEKGYDSIGWTTADIQVDRWSEEFAEGYRIEYDQDMPKFLNKYGKRWGAKVGKTTVSQSIEEKYEYYDVNREETFKSFINWRDTVRRELREQGAPMSNVSFSRIDNDTWIAFNTENGMEYDRVIEKAIPNLAEVWQMPITDTMKESVLTEGQPLYQDRESDGLSNRDLLANAFEGVAQNDIERKKIEEYKSKIELINSEEAHLHEVNEKIKELSFAKGPKDTKQLKDLHADATRTANRISTFDKQLLRLEASRPLQDVIDRERKMAFKRAQEKGKQAVAKARQKAAETQREIITRYQESRKKAVEGRHQTEMRHKIKGVVNELNQLLLHGTKDKHVMIGLQKAVADALDAVNMDTIGAEERIAKYDALIAKANDPDVIASLTATRDRIRQQGDNLAEKIAQLKAGYGEIKNSDDPLIANGYDEVIASKIDAVVSTVGNTPLRAMSMEQLEDVYDMYKMVLTRIREANRSFTMAKKETISTLANRVMMEVEQVGGKHPYRLAGSEKIGSFSWNNEKPVYAFERIGSRTFTEVFKSVRAGEDTWAKDVSEAKDFFKQESKKYHYDKWDMKRTFSFKSKTGQDFKLTLPQIMSLYAYSKRKQADKHLELGGFVFDSNIEVVEKKHGIPVKYKVNTATAHNISREILYDIVGKLSAEQKAFVDEMQEYLSSTMGEKGNEVSLVMYGVKLFKEKNYFPLKSAKQFMFEQNETAGEVRIKNSGFSKETVVNASNPVILANFMDVWGNHVNDMSMYHAFVLPLEDFNRVFSYKTPTSDSMDTESVKQFIQNAYGEEANTYISELIKDLNGGARVDQTAGIMNKLIGGFKKAAVFASASVVVQQPSAIVRAHAIIGDKYFLGLPKIESHKKLWEEVKKYAPVAIIKEMGYFDTNMGRSTVDYIKDEKTLASRADDFFSWAPAYADEATWGVIWNAVKRETKTKNPSLNSKSEEFLKIVGERFTEVVTKTQVYDSVLARSANMRSKDTGMKMATAFMAEPTTSINMLSDAVRQWKRGHKKQAMNTVSAVYGSVLLNAVLVSLVYAARDDDEDENYLEKYIGSLTTEIIDGMNPLTYIPFIKDIWSIAQGFDVERADMSLATKLIEAFEKASKTIFVDTSDMDDEELAQHNKEVNEAIWGIVDYIAALFGQPVKNIRRDLGAAKNIYYTIMRGQKGSMGSIFDQIIDSAKNAVPVWGWFPDESKGDKLYDAIIRGDETYADRLEGGFKSESSRNSALRGALRDNDPRIREAALARINGDPAEYMRLAKEIIAEGFPQDDVVKAINSEINAINKGETEASSGSKATGFFKTDDYISALINGDQAAAQAVKDDIINTAMANGKDLEDAEKSFTSSFKSAVWGAYEEGELDESQVSNMLTNYADMEEEEVDMKLQVYEWKATVPGADDITASAIADYNEFAEPAGISKADYYKAWRIYSDTDADIDPATGEGIAYSKVKKVMPQIDELPLTAAQKTALALCWWAESTVRKYKTW